jgi:hypothetical protein
MPPGKASCPRHFRFENFWPRVPGFKEVVQAARNEHVPGISPINILFFKLQCTSVRLRQWSKNLFGSARVELHIANEIMHRLDAVQENRQLTTEELQLRRELKSSLGLGSGGACTPTAGIMHDVAQGG